MIDPRYTPPLSPVVQGLLVLASLLAIAAFVLLLSGCVAVDILDCAAYQFTTNKCN